MVFCKNCVYSKIAINNYMFDQCKYNPKIRFFYDPIIEYKQCDLINKNCDCKYYKKKWWKFWIK